MKITERVEVTTVLVCIGVFRREKELYCAHDWLMRANAHNQPDSCISPVNYILTKRDAHQPPAEQEPWQCAP